MFTARDRRSVRDYLNDASIMALTCANKARTGTSGDPVAAGGARVCSAVLAEVRDAVDLRAPWLLDHGQVVCVLVSAVTVAQRSGFGLDRPVEELARAIRAEVEEGSGT